MPKNEKKLEWDLKATKQLMNNLQDQELGETDIELPKDTIKIDDLRRREALDRLYSLVDSLIEEIYITGKPVIELPSRSNSNIIWDEESDLLLLGRQIQKKQFHSLTSVADITRLMRVLEIINELLKKDMHATKREIFYTDVKLFQDQKNSDKSIEDVATMLYTTRNSTHVVASARGSCVGRLRIRDKNDIIDLEGLGSGGWGISPMLDNIEILESDAEFILVVEKDAAMMRLAEARFWKDYPCIILTAQGVGNVAVRMFLKRLSKELQLPVFSLVDSDPYGHYIHSVYMRGSKRLSYESPFLATPDIKLLGVLTRDLDKYNVPDDCRLDMNKTDIKRTKDLLKEDFVKKNKEWKKDLELALKIKKKAEIQALSSHGFEFLTEKYLPEKLTTGDWL
ncbi:MAG: Type 2 DNA topoisomerase 6 subunit A [Promethearchaeota archaeon]|jgi:meiotic recombination protein SPO11|nr:MAG: Type 2 DNA topoisomerase 6 subunit A [Candidatus Lokiarchaeota archaeon]